MSKKIIIFVFYCTCILQAAQPPYPKKHIDTLAQLGPAMKEIKTQIIKRPETPYVSSHRSGPRVDSDPEQRKNIKEKK